MNDSYMEHGWGDTKWNGKPATFSIEDFKKAYNSGARIINEALSEANDRRNERNEKIEELRLKAGMKPSKMFGEKKKPMQLNIWHGYDMNRYNPHSTYLMHSGRKGMKWGKNIYQEDYVPIGKEAQGKIGGGSGGKRTGQASVDMSNRTRYTAKNATTDNKKLFTVNNTDSAATKTAKNIGNAVWYDITTPKYQKFFDNLEVGQNTTKQVTKPIVEDAVQKAYEKKLRQNGWNVYVGRIDTMTPEEKQAFDKQYGTDYQYKKLGIVTQEDMDNGIYPTRQWFSANTYNNFGDRGRGYSINDTRDTTENQMNALKDGLTKATKQTLLNEKSKTMNEIDDEMVNSIVKEQLSGLLEEEFDPTADYAKKINAPGYGGALGGGSKEYYENEEDFRNGRAKRVKSTLDAVNNEITADKAATETVCSMFDDPSAIEKNLKEKFGPDTEISWDPMYDGGPVLCNVNFPSKKINDVTVPPYTYTVVPTKLNDALYLKEEKRDAARAEGEKKTQEQRLRGMEAGQRALEETKKIAQEQAEARKNAALNSSSIARDMAAKTQNSSSVSEGRAVREAQNKARELAETKLKGQAVREAQKKAREDEELKARGRAVREAQKKKKVNAGAARAMGNAYSSMYNMRKRMTHSERFSYGGLYDTDELYHWGILGMKWGRRRWQNEDGSLTEAGRAHYGYGSEREKNRHAEKVNEQQIELTKASRGGDRDSYKSKYDLKKLQVKQDKQKQDEARDKRRHEEELAKMKYRDAEQKRKNDAAKIRNEYKLEKLKAKNAQKLSKYELQTDREDMRRDYEEAREMNQFDYVYDRAEQRGRQAIDKHSNSTLNVAISSVAAAAAIKYGAPIVKDLITDWKNR